MPTQKARLPPSHTHTGVSVVEDLYKAREPLQLAAVYFLSPSPASVARLVADFAKRPLYPSVHVFFSSRWGGRGGWAAGGGGGQAERRLFQQGRGKGGLVLAMVASTTTGLHTRHTPAAACWAQGVA